MNLSELYKAKDGTIRMARLHVAPGVVVPATPENVALVAAAVADFNQQATSSPTAAQDWASYFAAALGVETNDAPDGYASALAARRNASSAPSAGAWPKPPATPRHSSAEIPDGYALALVKRREEA